MASVKGGRRSFVLVTTLLGAAACGPLKPPAELDQDARAFMELLRRDRLESALAVLRVDAPLDTMLAGLGQARDFLRAFSPESMKLIGWNVVYAGDTTGTLTYEARGAGRTALLSAIVFRAGPKAEIRAFHWQATAKPLAQANAFTLRGKSAAHYLFLFLAGAALVSCIGGAIFAGVQRMGLVWILVCLIGLGSASINWTTGRQAYNPLSFHLFGAGYVRRGEAAPWIVTWSLPLGTILMLLKWKRRKSPQPVEPVLA